MELEDEPSWGTFPPTATGLGVLGAVGAAALVLRGRRARGGLLALATFAGIVDEAHNGPRVLRRLVRRRKTTVNVIARAGDPDATTTLVVIAHHDAPQTGMLFDQTLQRRLHERAPSVLARFKTPLPQWWFGLSGPLSSLLAALSGRRKLARGGLAMGVLGTLLVADIWRSETVPGANDNLSGVAGLVGLAELLREQPVPGLRVLLVSCGAEETLQDGIRAFVASHREELDPARTAFVNLDTVGSPHLVLLEAEGPVRMEHYTAPWLRELFAIHAERLDIAAAARLQGARVDRQRDPQSRRLPDGDARLDHGLVQPGQLPPAERHPREPRLRHGGCDDAARLRGRRRPAGGAGRSPLATATARGAPVALCHLGGMPEGDTIHHAARRIRAVLLDRVPEQIRTPQRRHSADGWPERLAGREVSSVDAHGKHLFVRFEGELTLHSHLRMTGSWGVHREGARWKRAPHRAWLVLSSQGYDVVQFDGPVLELMRESAHALRPAAGGARSGRDRRALRCGGVHAAPARAGSVARDRRRAARPARAGGDRQRVEVGGVLRRRRRTRGARLGASPTKRRSRSPSSRTSG